MDWLQIRSDGAPQRNSLWNKIHSLYDINRPKRHDRSQTPTGRRIEAKNKRTAGVNLMKGWEKRNLCLTDPVGNLRTLFQRALFACLSAGTMFLYMTCFTDREVQPQYYIFLICITAWMLVWGITTRKIVKIKIDLLTLFCCLFGFYLMVRTVFSDTSSGGWYIAGGLIFYFLCKSVTVRNISFFNATIVCICILQALYGLLQYFNIIRFYSSFPILGSSDNPAGFAANLSIGYSFALFLLNSHQRLIKRLAVSALLIIGVSICLSESRTGIITIILASVLFFIHRYREFWKRKKKAGIIIFGIAFLALSAILFYSKSQSASGRLLIWNVTADLIGDHLLTGTGNGGFKAQYMLYQGKYFLENPDSAFAPLADNVKYPFNEYLQLVAEYGIIGVVFLTVFLLIIIKYNRKKFSPYLLSLLSLMLFSCFSYPLHYSFVWVVLIYSISRLARNAPVIPRLTISVRPYARLFVICGSFLYADFLIKDIKFESEWKTISQLSLDGQTEEMLPAYVSLYKEWNGNPFFIYNYGAELNYIKRYDQSIKLLEANLLYFNDYDVQMILADNYANLKDWKNTERCYKLAASMCPGRFMPLKGLMTTYIETGNKAAAVQTASEIVHKKIKIPSQTVATIIYEARNYIRQESGDAQ